MPGVRLALNTNVDEVFRDLDAYVEAIQSVAIPRALNELSGNAFTVGLREMSKQYGLAQNVLRKYLRQVAATTPGGIKAVIEAFGAGLPLFLFSPSPSQPTRGKPRGKGVTVRLKGKRVFIRGAFIQRMPNGHVGIFIRGTYGAARRGTATGEAFGRFIYTKERKPINELYTASPSTIFANDRVVEAMNNRVEEQAPVVLARNIRFVASRL